MPTAGWDRPIMIVHGTDDLTVPIPVSVALQLQLAAGGADFQFKVYPGTDHRSVVPASDRDTSGFLSALLPRRADPAGLGPRDRTQRGPAADFDCGALSAGVERGHAHAESDATPATPAITATSADTKVAPAATMVRSSAVDPM
ncbi:prolyl oligopeptidase family protein [Rhodococcus sp. MTM3W5.2]|nr:prolyl oligopeptidase family protein [Rhodococcus sp. MTM3W5.2]